MNKRFSLFLVLFGLISIFTLQSCGDEEMLVPRPPSFLRTDLPEHEYTKMALDEPYVYEVSKSYLVRPVMYKNEVTSHQEINLGPLNGVLYLNYYTLPNKDTLVRYINQSNDKVDEHQIKASKIERKRYIFPDKKVYGTFFELQGDVATNYQFYLTDSVNHFVRGEVLMNCKPNYDSLRPTLDYLKKDLQHMIETFEWKSK